MSNTNEFIIKRAEQLGIKQADIVKRIAQKRGRESTLYKGIVNKWYKDKQEPGKDYLLDLAEILNVSVESILRGKEMPAVTSSRATAYTAALSGDKGVIDRLFGSLESHDIRVTTTDEYGKSFVDYVLEFGNYKAFKIALEAGYCKADYSSIFFDLTSGDKTKAVDLLRMIIHADDLDVFQGVFSRLESIGVGTDSGTFVNDFSIPGELCGDIVKSNRILHDFIDAKPFSKKRNREHQPRNHSESG